MDDAGLCWQGTLPGLDDLGPVWAVVQPNMSPKLGVGWVDLYWAGPSDQWPHGVLFTGVTEDVATFPTGEAAIEALKDAFGPDWADDKRFQGARLVEFTAAR